MENNNLKKRVKSFGLVALVLLVALIFVGLVSSQSVFQRSFVGTNPFSGIDSAPSFSSDQCQMGQDFILQISPTGCTPSVVRSDLLEEQNVPVFCPVLATKINPLIEVESIDGVSFSGGNSKDVSGVGFLSSRAALNNPNVKLNTPVLGNIGYAVIVLKQNKNESSMPDFAEGNLTARITYDVEKTLGVGQSTFYLPVMTDSEWNQNFERYGFWEGKGYLRADLVEQDGASISIYSDRESLSSNSGTEKRVIATENIPLGKTSRNIGIPGFDYCLGSLSLKLDAVEAPDTVARIEVNGNSLELKSGQKFLDNKCLIRTIEKKGISQSVVISCNEDGKRSSFELVSNPRIEIEVEGVIRNYTAGDALLNKDGEIFVYNDEKTVFLAYVSTKGDTTNEEDLTAGLVALPVIKGTTRLTDAQLEDFANFFKRSNDGDIGNFLKDPSVLSGLKVLANGILSAGESTSRKLVGGEDLEGIAFHIPVDFLGKNIRLEGFSDPVDEDLSTSDPKVLDNYHKALDDYNTVIESFASGIYPPEEKKTLGENALQSLIKVNYDLNQKRTALDLCSQFEDQYGTKKLLGVCNSLSKLSNSEQDVRTVSVNKKLYDVSFDRIREPKFEELGAVVSVLTPEKENIPLNLRKDRVAVLDQTTGAFIQLMDVSKDSFGEESIRLRTNLRDGVLEQAGAVLTGSTTIITLRKNLPDSRQGYTFNLNQVNLKSVAKVSLVPKINYAETTANFPFKVYIEKRAIQLSPEKTKDRIESLNATLEKWNSINDKLGNAVEVGNKLCLGVGTYLTVKNFFSNLAGEGIARQKVMRGSGGYFSICEKEIANTGRSRSSCLLDKNEEIENAVGEYAKAIEAQNEKIKNLQSGVLTKQFIGEDVVDTGELMKRYVEDSSYKSGISQGLEFAGINTIEVKGEQVSVSKIVENINSNTIYLTQARDLELNSKLLKSSDPVVRGIAEGEIKTMLADVWVNSRVEVDRKTLSDKYSAPEVGFISTGETKELPVRTITNFGDIKGRLSNSAQGIEDDSSHVYIVKDRSTSIEYLLILDDDFVVDATYKMEGNEPILQTTPNPLGLNPKYYDENIYNNPYQSGTAQVRYYETGQYAGLPAIVPFDTKHGWYAGVKSTLPIGSAIKSYDDSGRVSSFFLCNIGLDGKEEFYSTTGDDKCVMINTAINAPFDKFPGLSDSEATSLTLAAMRAIESASSLHSSGISKIKIPDGNNVPHEIEVGPPAVGVPDIQCQDFMSSVECNLLFNVCDPVVCPSSRCNLGGNYNVKDVAATGIAGSIALCLPNFPEVKVPVCLTGVHAGVEGYLSVLENYQDCLQHSLDTGEQIGVCDELHSIYMCEFLWRQGLPIANEVVPTVIGKIFGKGNTRGGGEYLGVADAWKGAKDSAEFFAQNYAVQSYNAFKIRSTSGVGGNICKNWVSLRAPSEGSFLDSITKPRVPPQFYGRFDEIPYTTATVPPVSQYKVFYHIYAGEDIPAYYQVYLKSEGQAFFQDTSPTRLVASGSILSGEYATATKDFSAPSGYTKLCIVVNDHEECGFKQVTTDFGLNYITEKYVADEASRTDITSSSACVSGTPNVASFVAPSLQAGAEEFVNPSIYNRGITRICSTDNPGDVSENPRWVSVGYCDTPNLGCWLDTQSVKDSVKHQGIEEEAVGEVSDNYINTLRNENGLLDESGFASLTKKINEESNLLTKINLVNQNLKKVFFNYEKGFLTLVRGDSYAGLALDAFQKVVVKEKTGVVTIEEPCVPDDAREECREFFREDISKEVEDILKILDSDSAHSSVDIANSAKARASVVEKKMNNYPVLKFSAGVAGEDLYFMFSNIAGENKWTWSRDLSAFYTYKDTQPPVSAPILSLSEKNKNSINTLADQSYYEGLEHITNRVRDNKEGGIVNTLTKTITLGRASNAKLSTDYSEMTFEGIFHVSSSITRPTLSEPLTLRYNNPSWQYQDYLTSGGPWKDVSSSDELSLMKDLVNRGFLDGTALIFSLSSEGLLFVSDKESISTQKETCIGYSECQKILASKVGSVASNLKNSRVGSVSALSDEIVQRDTGLPNFECLALAVAYQETKIQHCGSSIGNGFQQNGNPLYCEGNPSQVIHGAGTDFGMMQINTGIHKIDSTEVDTLEENVKFGLNLLINYYNSEPMVYSCYNPVSGARIRESDFVSVEYSGWKRSLRRYNGWNSPSNCFRDDNNDGVLEAVGDPIYVESIISPSRINTLKNLFPSVCG